MRKRLVWIAAACLAAALSSAQAQMEQLIRVNLPYAARVGATTLPAGQYTIRDLKEDGSSNSILHIRSDNGPSVSAVVMRISDPDSRTADQTQVVLRREGSGYGIDKIWLEGRDYGYELIDRK